MNIITYLRSIVVVALLMSFSGVVLAGSSETFPSRIDKQTKAVEAASKAKEINPGELTSLKKEIKAILALYTLYWSDKKITPKEAKALERKLNNSDVNLFRKKYN